MLLLMPFEEKRCTHCGEPVDDAGGLIVTGFVAPSTAGNMRVGFSPALPYCSQAHADAGLRGIASALESEPVQK